MCLLCTMAGRHAQAKANDTEYTPITDKTYQYTDRLAQAKAVDQSLVQFMKGKRRWGSLHGHSEGSLLDGGAKIKDIMLKAKQMGQDFVAITDHGNLFGAVKAHQAAAEVGIKHIVGSELYLTPPGRTMADNSFAKGEKAYYHLVTIAMNRTGYQNLCALSSIGYSDGFYRAPRIDRETLAAHSEGLIVTSSCVGGSIPNNAYDGNFYAAESDMEWFMKQFGDRFYIEVQNHGIEIEEKAFEYMRAMSQKYNIPTIATADSHYLDADDPINHDALLCIGTGQKIDQEKRTFKFSGSGYHYMAEEEIVQLFPHDQEAIYRTGELADRVDDTVIDFGDIKLPHFTPPDDGEFHNWVANGGKNRWL
jgi:DNA polymerase III subunit alpha